MFDRWLSEIRYRWRALVGRDHMEDELDAELQFHLEQEQHKLEARGLAPQDASRQARVRFGGLERAREDVRDARGTRLVEDLWTDLRYVVRTLRTQRMFTVGVAATLALGLGANATMFGIVDRLMFRDPQGLRHADRVHRVHLQWTQNGERRSDRGVQYPRLVDFTRETHSFDLVAGFQVRTLALGQGEDAQEQRVAVVSSSYLEFFDAHSILGRWFTDADDRPATGTPVVVLGHSYWLTRYGGRANALGQTLRVDRLEATIIGVAPAGFAGLGDEGAPAAYVPLATFAHALRGPSYATSYNWSWLEVLVRRAPGVSIAAANADLSNAFTASWRVVNREGGQATDPAIAKPSAALGPIHLGRGPDAGLDARVTLWIGGVAVVVLLIACANVANLFLSRSVSRQRDVALRLALGIGRPRLTRQIVMESVALGVMGGLGGMAIAQWGGGALRNLLLPDAAGAAVLTDLRTVRYAFGLAVLAGSLTAIVPAALAGRVDVVDALKSGGRGTAHRRSRLQGVLVVVQAALSVLLLVGAALFVRSLQHAEGHRVGVDVDRVVYASVNARGVQLPDTEMRTLVARMIEAARTVPGVTHVSSAASVPFWSNEGRPLYVSGIANVGELGRFTLQTGSSDYFATTGTRVLRGRAFGAEDREGAPPVILVSDLMARALWPGRDALAQCLRVGDERGPCRAVVGIAEDVAMESLEPSRQFTYYLPAAQYPEAPSPQLFVRLDGSPTASMPVLRTRLQALLPGAAYVNVVPMRDLFTPQFRAWRFGATLFVAFGGLAFLLAALGLHSLLAYEGARREQEFGVRMALGASRGRILTVVVARGAGLALLGVAIGLALALAAARPFQPLLFHQSARDPLILSGIAVALVVVGCLASAVTAWRATRLDPSMTLRAD